jgi:SulP family sulfate permease
VELESPHEHGLSIELPDGVRLYEIAGPMFFGAAKSAMEVIAAVGGGRDHTFVLNMQRVPTIDATGLVALESVLDRLFRSHIKVIFAGLTPDVADLLDRAGIKREPGRLAYAPDVETAISMAIVHGARARRTVEPPTAAA